jgi:hypothetical protein
MPEISQTELDGLVAAREERDRLRRIGNQVAKVCLVIGGNVPPVVLSQTTAQYALWAMQEKDQRGEYGGLYVDDRSFVRAALEELRIAVAPAVETPLKWRADTDPVIRQILAFLDERAKGWDESDDRGVEPYAYGARNEARALADQVRDLVRMNGAQRIVAETLATATPGSH